MSSHTKFKIGDLIIYPQDHPVDSSNDYGIVTEVIPGNNDLDYCYRIQWAIDKKATIEEWDFAERNFLLARRP